MSFIIPKYSLKKALFIVVLSLFIGSLTVYSQSLRFNGSSQYLNSGANPSLDIDGDFSISFWIRIDNGETDGKIISKSGNLLGVFSSAFNVELNASNQVVVSWEETVFVLLGSYSFTSTTAIPNNVWHQVAITYNATTDTLSIYIDGVLDSSDNSAYGDPNVTGWDTLIGRKQNTDGTVPSPGYYDGRMDEVRFWDVTLTQEQIQFMMNQQIEDNGGVAHGSILELDVPGPLNWVNLTGYYQMNSVVSGTPDQVLDISGFSNDASLFNITGTNGNRPPLPYITRTNFPFSWSNMAGYSNGIQKEIPGTASIVDPTISIDWNIVRVRLQTTLDDDSDLPVSSNGIRKVLGLIIDNNDQLIIDGSTNALGYGTGYALHVSDYLYLRGVLDLEGGSQLFQGDACVIVQVGNGYLERDQQGSANGYTYNYWSSPVTEDGSSTYILDDVFSNVTFSSSGLNGSLAPLTIADYWIWKFDDRTEGDYSQWQPIGSSGTMNIGEGFTMKGPEITSAVSDIANYVFQGVPNNGDITLVVNSGNQYLIGNPYPSALDADQFILDNSGIVDEDPSPAFSGTLYFYEHWGGNSHYLSDYQGGYATYNLSGGLGAGSGTAASGGGTKVPERYIPVAQGFFITAENSGTIQFNNGQRTFQLEDGSNSLFLKNEKLEKQKSTDTRRKLRIGIEMEKGFKKEILLTEDPRTTEGIDFGFDGKLIDGFSHDIFWNIEDEKYSIQGVPEFTKNSVFELGIQMESAGEIKIKVNVFENNKGLNKVYLLDRESKKTTNIVKNSVVLNLDEGDYKDRFAIVFLPVEKPVKHESELIEGIEAVMNNTYKEVQITRKVDAEIREVSIFNLLGQKVYSTNSRLDERFIRIPVSQQQGVYMLRVLTDKGIVGKQILIE